MSVGEQHSDTIFGCPCVDPLTRLDSRIQTYLFYLRFPNQYKPARLHQAYFSLVQSQFSFVPAYVIREIDPSWKPTGEPTFQLSICVRGNKFQEEPKPVEVHAWQYSTTAELIETPEASKTFGHNKPHMSKPFSVTFLAVDSDVLLPHFYLGRNTVRAHFRQVDNRFVRENR